MLLPQLRRRLKTISDDNKGLQDILQSMQKATEVLSVEPYNGKVHNTKITLLIDKGSNYPEQERYVERVHFYNRVALNKIIPANAFYPKTSVEDAIEVLNLQYGCDFTEDDVEFIGGVLVTKETSLGYYNAAAEGTNIVNPNCNPTSLSMQRFNSFIPETHQNGALTIQLIKNGSTITIIIRPSQVQLQGVTITIINMIRWFANGQDVNIVDGNGGFGQYRVYNNSISGSRNGDGDDGPILPSPGGLTPPGPSGPNPTSIRIMKTQGEPVETDIFEWLLEAEEGLDAETLAEARSLGLSVHSCGICIS